MYDLETGYGHGTYLLVKQKGLWNSKTAYKEQTISVTPSLVGKQ